MWISRKRYNELRRKAADNEILISDLNLWKAKYTALEEGKASVLHDNQGEVIYVLTGSQLEHATEEGRRAMDKLDIVEPELAKYKQMYVDEVQKRLELLQYITEIHVGGNKDEISESHPEA